ncbi:cyclic lactone autoinducer peptide [Brevibacillus sp. B_LB10_24]
MVKFLTKPLFQTTAKVLAVVAMMNIGTTSMFMMYQPEPPKKSS